MYSWLAKIQAYALEFVATFEEGFILRSESRR